MDIVPFIDAGDSSPKSGSRLAARLRAFLPQANSRFYFRLKLLALVLVVVGSRWWVVKDFGLPVPYWDQWDAEAEKLYLPWLEHRLDPMALFAPHNEHRVAITRLYSLALLEANGQWDPRLQMAVNALLAACVAVFLAVVLSRIFGRRRENIILLLIAALWSLPFGFASTTGGFHSSWYFFIFLALVSLWGLLLKPNFSVGWWLGALAAPLGIFTMASGFVAGAVVIVVSGWQMMVEAKSRWTHLPSMLVGTATLVTGLLLNHSPDHHTQLRADGVGTYLGALGRNLAWPWSETPWCALILFLPVALCAMVIIRNRQKLTSAQLIVAGLAIWAVAQALAAAYARGYNPVGSRHMETLTIGVLANLLALMILADHYGVGVGRSRLTQYLCGAWAFVLIAGLGHLTAWSLEKGLLPLAALNHTYVTACQEFLAGQPDAHFERGQLIPGPEPEELEALLLNPTLQTIYPPCLQLPQPLRHVGGEPSPFVENGFQPGTGKYFGQTSVGSYNREGNAAIGGFRSDIIEPRSAFLQIPVAGYPKAPGMSLKLVVEGSQQEIPLKLRRDPGGTWKAFKIRSPGAPFRIVAEDQNPDSWLAVAAPRQLGWLSIVSETLLGTGHQLVFLGLLLFLFLSPFPNWLWSQISGAAPRGATGSLADHASNREAAA
jgi:hypothetical protein